MPKKSVPDPAVVAAEEILKHAGGEYILLYVGDTTSIYRHASPGTMAWLAARLLKWAAE